MTFHSGTVLKVGIPVLVLVWLFGTNNPGMLLALGLVVAGSAFYLWRKDRSEMQSVLGELGPAQKSSASMRLVCSLVGQPTRRPQSSHMTAYFFTPAGVMAI